MGKKAQKESKEFLSCKRAPSCLFKVKKSKIAHCVLKRHESVCLVKKQTFRRRTKQNFAKLNFHNTQVRNMLGSGYYGEVFDAKLGNFSHVVKVIKNLESYNTEVEAYAKIHLKSNKVGFPIMYEHFEEENVGYIFLEKMDYTLSKLVKSVNLSTKERAEILLELMQRVYQLHKCGLVHRDLKWNNFMLSNGKIKMIDFGSAKSPPEKDETGSIFGSVRYLGKNGHIFHLQTFTDDLESIGWLMLELVEKKLPWNKICEKKCSNVDEFSKVSSQVKKMKEKFLAKDDIENTGNKFVLDFLKRVREQKFSSELPVQLYKDLEKNLTVFIDSHTDISKWRQWKCENQEVECKMRPLFGAPLLEFECRKFEVMTLPKELIEMYRKKTELESSTVHNTAIDIAYNVKSFKYLTFDHVPHQEKFLAEAAKPEAKVWICRFKLERGYHFSTFTSCSGTIISFNGLPEVYPITRFHNIIRWKYVEGDDLENQWESGYKALYWLLLIVSAGSVSKWMQDNHVWN